MNEALSSNLVLFSKGLGMMLTIFGVAGVADCMKHCVIGTAEASEVKPDLGISLMAMSMCGVNLVLVLIISFVIHNKVVLLETQANAVIVSGAIMGLSIYFGSKALGMVARYGFPAYVKQKKFSTFLYFSLMMSEMISMFGFMLSIVMTMEAGGAPKK